MTRRGWILVIAAALVVAAIAYQNRHERAALALGPLHLYAVPLAILLLAFFLLGMGAMLLLSLPADRRTRELLRAHGLLDADPAFRPAPTDRAYVTAAPSGPPPVDHPPIRSTPADSPAEP